MLSPGDKLQAVWQFGAHNRSKSNVFMINKNSGDMQSHQETSDRGPSALSEALKKAEERSQPQPQSQSPPAARSNRCQLAKTRILSPSTMLLLLMLNLPRPNEARVVESAGEGVNGLSGGDSARPEEGPVKATSSLRQVFVPVLSNGHSLQQQLEQDATYSANNRGSSSFAFRTSHRFGERTNPIDPFKLGRKPAQVVAMQRRHDKPYRGGWSQPDPRRSYSLQLNMVEGAANLGAKLAVLPAPPPRRFPLVLKSADFRNSSPLKPGKSLKRISDFETAFGKQTNSNATEEEPSWRLSSSSSSQISQDAENNPKYSSLAGSESSRRKSPEQQQASMIALIRYVPVLLSMPAQQLVVPGQQTRGGLLAPRRPTNLDGGQPDELPYYSFYRAPSERLVRYQIAGEPAEPANQVQRPFQQQVGEQQATAASSAPQWKPIGGNQAVALQTTDLMFEPDYALLSHQAHLAPANLQPTIALIQPGELGAAMSLAGIPAGSAARLAYLPLSAAQTAPGMGAASKAALSSYASKLISMLRPSALLSSIAPPLPASNPNGAQHYPASQQQVYLLAPAESLAVAPNRHAAAAAQSSYTPAATIVSVNQARQMALIKADDLLLNQASTKLHSSSASSSFSQSARGSSGHSQVRGQPTSWLHEQSNGLICVHSIMQTDGQTSKFPAPEVQGKSARFQQAPLLLSPLIVADEQTVLGPPVATTTSSSTVGSLSTLDGADGGSFEYVPQVVGSSTDRPSSGVKQDAARWPSVKSDGHQQQQQSIKESPAKLAKRLKSSATSSTPSSLKFQELSQQTIQDEPAHFEADFMQRKLPASSRQLKLVSSSSENRSYFENNTSLPARSDKSSKGAEPIEPAPGWPAPEDKQSIIPFTIKDKIEMPYRRGQNSFHSNDPVQYDEQAEGETEPPPLKRAKQAGLSSLDERRAKTSFVSSTTRYTTPTPNETGIKRHSAKKTPMDEIDYLKEAAPGARDTVSGYTLPLLICALNLVLTD